MKTKFKDGDVLVSDSKKIISALKGNYDNGEFRDYACIDSNVINIKPSGIWFEITDWRPATAKEREKLYKAIESLRQKAERDLAKITELLKVINF